MIDKDDFFETRLVEVPTMDKQRKDLNRLFIMLAIMLVLTGLTIYFT